MHECVHTQSISQSMHASEKRKINSRTFEDSVWEMLQNVVYFSPLNRHYENMNNVQLTAPLKLIF